MRASEALEVMEDSHQHIMVSEDNVVLHTLSFLLSDRNIDTFPRFCRANSSACRLDDKSTKVRAIPRLMRILNHFSFQINDSNMKDLAHLADKYIIDSLHKDLEVHKYFPKDLNVTELCAKVYVIS